MKPLTFATYEVDVDIPTVAHVKEVEPNFFRHQPKELISTLFSTAKKFHPSCHTVILTDQKTSFPEEFKQDKIVRFDLNTFNLTLSRTEAQVKFLKQSQGNSHLIFLDTDMLIQADLSKIFEQHFDVAVTLREHQMPINGGLILLNANGYDACCRFMESVLKMMYEDFKSFQAWYGSQHALKKIVTSQDQELKENTIINWNGVRILLLPSSLYNFTAPTTKMDGPYPDKKILHFKGTRKKCQLAYFKQYLED